MSFFDAVDKCWGKSHGLFDFFYLSLMIYGYYYKKLLRL
jgi:hypothetical protein